MLTAFDFAKPVSTEESYAFGVEPQRLAAVLGQLAQDVSEGKIAVVSGTVTTTAMVDDFVKTVLTLTLHERLK